MGHGIPHGIPHGYEQVDPRTARRVPLWQELSDTDPIFPGDPPVSFETSATIAGSGYLVERITSLGTHTGTHISAPAHFVEGGATLAELDEGPALMPLVVIDVRARVEAGAGAFFVGVPELERYEERFGRIPAGGCVLLLTGFSGRYGGDGQGYFDPAPGFCGAGVAWLFDSRGILAVGSDTFGPDASTDEGYGATSAALRRGGITVENVGPGLAQMRPFGDWIAINGARPRFSGFPVGITGFTLPHDDLEA